MPLYGLDFYQEQLDVIDGIVKAAKSEALVVVTLYSPFMCAAHTVGHSLMTEHLNQEPEQTARGLEIVTESLMLFVSSCIELGVDGFYHSTQGGEAGHFQQADTFERFIKPYDLALMEEINAACSFNILHVCDYVMDYDDFTPFLDYPGHIVNCPLKVGQRTLTPREAAELFGRPYMGGLERKGILAGGTPEQIQSAVETILQDAPERFVLGADCTVPNDTPWENLKTAVDAAHKHAAV
jgi:uroporphyrinogen decarboxylase